METKAKFLTTKQMTLIALMTALTCILGPLSIPLPFSPVPISFTNLVLYFSVFVLGTKFSTISYIVYLLIGLVGLPVFSGFSGGPAKVAGPTGGYLVGFVFLTVIAGFFVEHFKGKLSFAVLGIIGISRCRIFSSSFGTLIFSGRTAAAKLGILSRGREPPPICDSQGTT